MQYIAEIFVLIAYAFLGVTYLIKNKKNLIFLLSSLSNLSFTVSYVLMQAWSGVAMNIIGIVRNLAFFFIAKNINNQKFWKNLALSITLCAMLICSIFTFNGVLSLMSVVATGFYTFAIYNENGSAYKILGALASVSWIIYNLFIKLYLSVVFECVMVICAIVGLIRGSNHKNQNVKTENNQIEEVDL